MDNLNGRNKYNIQLSVVTLEVLVRALLRSVLITLSLERTNKDEHTKSVNRMVTQDSDVPH